MKLLLDQLETSLDVRNYYLSLFVALAVPDIAGAMNSENGMANGEKYKAWYEDWVRPRFNEGVREDLPKHMRDHVKEVKNPLDGESCYRFRCSLLHQGRATHPKSAFTRIIFIEPGAVTGGIHYLNMNGALCIDLRKFCAEVIAGARMWLEQVEQTPLYQSNYEQFARRHENGLAPYIGGVPVVG